LLEYTLAALGSSNKRGVNVKLFACGITVAHFIDRLNLKILVVNLTKNAVLVFFAFPHDFLKLLVYDFVA
jgi:hypothetical protein